MMQVFSSSSFRSLCSFCSAGEDLPDAVQLHLHCNLCDWDDSEGKRTCCIASDLKSVCDCVHWLTRQHTEDEGNAVQLDSQYQTQGLSPEGHAEVCTSFLGVYLILTRIHHSSLSENEEYSVCSIQTKSFAFSAFSFELDEWLQYKNKDRNFPHCVMINIKNPNK